ncbi:MAG TPA: hypothetical protein VLA46_03125 [Saprospiraceae bacterium]|nr:hypothetical protein [Saprospiraceae bacterium]
MNYLANFSWATLLLTSCTSEGDMIGTYEADRYHFLEMAPLSVFQKTGFASGATLELNEDSSFVYKTCGNVQEGYWSIHADSLILDVQSNRWRTDSLQEHGFNGRWPQPCFNTAFSIDGDDLIHLHNRNPDMEGDYRVFTRLKKIKD